MLARLQKLPTSPVANLVDTTGAGDLFAAGFLFGLTNGQDVIAATEIGHRCAGEIIQQIGGKVA